MGTRIWYLSFFLCAALMNSLQKMSNMQSNHMAWLTFTHTVAVCIDQVAVINSSNHWYTSVKCLQSLCWQTLWHVLSGLLCTQLRHMIIAWMSHANCFNSLVKKIIIISHCKFINVLWATVSFDWIWRILKPYIVLSWPNQNDMCPRSKQKMCKILGTFMNVRYFVLLCLHVSAPVCKSNEDG